MPASTLQTPISDLVLHEVCPGWSREKVVLTGGVSIPVLTVLANVSGKLKPIDFGASDVAAKTPAAVAYEPIDTTAGDKSGVVIARGAVVSLNDLVWPAGATSAQKTTALAQLELRGIVARETA